MPRTTGLLKLLAFALACTLLTAPVPAQVNEGIVTGRAVDANNGIFPSAGVEFQPKGVSTVTDAPGNFTIDNLAPGEYRLTVTFVGLASSGPERLDHRHGRAPTQRSRSDQS